VAREFDVQNSLRCGERQTGLRSRKSVASSSAGLEQADKLEQSAQLWCTNLPLGTPFRPETPLGLAAPQRYNAQAGKILSSAGLVIPGWMDTFLTMGLVVTATMNSAHFPKSHSVESRPEYDSE